MLVWLAPVAALLFWFFFLRARRVKVKNDVTVVTSDSPRFGFGRGLTR